MDGYTHAVIHDLDEDSIRNIQSIDDINEKNIVYCVNLEHAQAIATQGLSQAWENIIIMDLAGVR